MKLYRVTLCGMHSGFQTGATSYGMSYVVADNSHEAYCKVKKFIDEKNLDFERARRLDKIELIADEKQYGESGTMLYL